MNKEELRAINWCDMATFRIGQSDLFPSPQAQVGPLKLLRHKRIELLSGTQPGADLRGDAG